MSLTEHLPFIFFFLCPPFSFRRTISRPTPMASSDLRPLPQRPLSLAFLLACQPPWPRPHVASAFPWFTRLLGAEEAAVPGDTPSTVAFVRTHSCSTGQAQTSQNVLHSPPPAPFKVGPSTCPAEPVLSGEIGRPDSPKQRRSNLP